MGNHTLANSEEEDWDLEIKPKAKLLDFNFSEIWRYRELMLFFVKRDFIAQYKQTILGPVVAFYSADSDNGHVSYALYTGCTFADRWVPPVLFYMSGITIWNYFSVCLTSTSNTFLANANIFGKVYFPRIIMPVSVIISNLIRFGIQFLFGCYCYCILFIQGLHRSSYI